MKIVFPYWLHGHEHCTFDDTITKSWDRGFIMHLMQLALGLYVVYSR